MPIDQLKNLEKIGELRSESPSLAEFNGLLRSGQKRLTDAENTTLSLESRFDLAYNASHALSLAALRWHGFRSTNRFLVFQCLEHTVKFSKEKWRVLDHAHRKRNLAEYEGSVEIDLSLVESLIRITREIETAISGLGEPELGWTD